MPGLFVFSPLHKQKNVSFLYYNAVYMITFFVCPPSQQIMDIYKTWYDHKKTEECLNAVHFSFVQSVVSLRQLVRLSDISIVSLEPKSGVR